MKKNCSATALKLLAIIAMTVDHIALTFVPQESWLHYIMRLFSRLTAPIMAFFIAEGFQHTRSRKKYLLRLSAFGLISQPFYYLLFYGSFSVIGILLHWNVMISLAIALLALIPIWKYSGERGSGRRMKLQRWFFYVYYPAHMAALLGIQICMKYLSHS